MLRGPLRLDPREMVGPALIVMLTVGLIATFITAFALSGGGEAKAPGEVAPPAEGTPGPPPEGGLVVTAVPTIRFDKKELTVPAGQAVTITFDNKDTGVPHNFAVYADDGFKQAVAKAEICSAPCQKSVTLQGLQPGTYYFQCDVHPVPSMRGTLTVE